LLICSSFYIDIFNILIFVYLINNILWMFAM